MYDRPSLNLSRKTFMDFEYEIGIWYQSDVIPVRFYQMKENKGL